MVQANPHVQVYYSSIALNNIGVSLLELQNYRQARITFNDALYAMRTTYAKNSEESTATPARIDARVRKAVECLAESKASTSKAPCVALPSHRSLSFASSAGDIQVQVHLGTPIRIDEFDNLENRDQDLEATILMYNFALAHLFCSKTCSSKSLAVKLFDGALKLFDMTYEVVDTKLLPLELAETCGQHEIAVFTLAIMVLHIRAHVLTEAGILSKVLECYEKLVLLGAVLSNTAVPAGASHTMSIAAGAA